MTELYKKRQERRKETAEDFTPPALVKEMLDKIPASYYKDPSKTFLEPAAGDGNFLIEILQRKLDNKISPLIALQSLYGVELMEDNVIYMKERLLSILPPNTDLTKAQAILDKNIICHDALEWDFEKWTSKIIKTNPLF
jgi:hypothetical protein